MFEYRAPGGCSYKVLSGGGQEGDQNKKLSKWSDLGMKGQKKRTAVRTWGRVKTGEGIYTKLFLEGLLLRD